MARVQTDQLTFGDFTTGLSAEEHSRVCGILRAQSPNKRVELPWEEQRRILTAAAPAPTAIPEVSAVEDQVAHAPAPGYVDSAPASLRQPDYVQISASNRVDSSSESSYISSSDKQGYYQSPTDSVASSESESVQGKDTVKDDSNGNGNNFNGSAKPKERRNKKKRPPNYYKDLEAGAAETVVTEVPAPLQRPVENHVDVRPQRIPESSGQTEPVGASHQYVPVKDVATSNNPSNVSVTPLPNDVPASPLQEPPRTILKTIGESEIKHRPNVDPVVPSPSVVVVPNGPVSPLPVPADAVKPSAVDTPEVSSHSNPAEAMKEEEAGRHVSNPSQDAPAAGNSHNAMGESQEDAKSVEAVNQSDDSQSEQSLNNSNPPAVSSPPPTTPRTWAGLFKGSSSPQMAHNTPIAYVAHVGNDESAPATVPTPAQGPTGEPQAKLAEKTVVPPEDDDHIRGLGEYLLEPKVSHKPVALQPRGLVNKGNWCYINATLQAMVACPPMYNLMKNMPLPSSPNKRGPTATPILDCLMEFTSEFGSMPNSQKTIAGKKPAQDLRPGSPFEPTYVYHMLSLIKSTLSSKGRQEDAEEFLSCVLNGIHEEMQVAMKMAQKDNQPKMNGELTPKSDGPSSPIPREDGAVEGFMMEQEEGDEDEWEQVGPKNKSTVTRTANFVRTPVSDIFGGQLRSIFHQHGTRESATLQPFFTLQLDIQSEKIWTVKDALEAMVTKETIHGYTCSKTKQEVEASRRMMIEELPPVLVLHLKRFVYDKTGGSQKVQKRVDFNIELDINKELLSPAVKNKLHQGQRTYRLFAVVYHHGKNATGGHYTTDVFHVGINGWLRFDDQNVKVVTSQQVMKYTPPRVPYLLYYRRCDLI
ncbi:ubiquitin carboxyl-terminal hydrolase 10-like isoform X1 [Branchiostoma floridae x Branchiostoma japonicum]